MPRAGRLVYPDTPHHVTQRGNRRAPIFFESGDQQIYLRLLGEETRRYEVNVWAYCLMPNHVHLILTPADDIGLSRALAQTHRRYSAFVNARAGWTGHLFQDRFASVAMDEEHLVSAARYVLMNPVRARLVRRAQDWPWSSVQAHLAGKSDGLVNLQPLQDRIPDLECLLEDSAAAELRHRAAFRALRQAETSGRPLMKGQVMVSQSE